MFIFLGDFWVRDGGQWKMIRGTTSPGVYGTKGVPDSRNTPVIGARWGATVWVDSLFNVYIFGGIGIGASGAGIQIFIYRF